MSGAMQRMIGRIGSPAAQAICSAALAANRGNTSALGANGSNSQSAREVHAQRAIAVYPRPVCASGRNAAVPALLAV